MCSLWEGNSTVCVWRHDWGEKPDTVLIGEAPGSQEDLKGIPFVGKAGELLRKVLGMASVPLYRVSVDNVVRCRPPDNRTPTAEECKICSQYLNHSILSTDPKIVILLGRTAYQWAYNWKRRAYSVTEDRGVLKSDELRPELHGRHVILTFHPAYILRNMAALEYMLRDLDSIGTIKNPNHSPEINPPLDSYTVLDLETTGLYPWEKDARILCVGHQRVWNGVAGEVLVDSNISPLFSKFSSVVGHNIKWDMRWLHGSPILYDTKVYAHLLDENRTSLSLESLARHELSVPSWKVDRTKMADMRYEDLVEYNKKDVIYTHALFCKLFRQVSEQGLSNLCDFEHEVLSCFLDIERAGMKVDMGRWHTLSEELQQELIDLRQKMTDIAQVLINPNSTKQLQAYLYGTRGFRPIRKTATGLSVDDASLTALRENYPNDPFLPLLSEYRDVYHEWANFIATLPRWIDTQQFVHPEYDTTGTVTGRVSCKNPPIQQAPQGSHSKFKQLFVSRYGGRGVIAVFDYSQLELRVGAWYSRDPAMLQTFASGGDIHESTRAFLFPGDPQPGQRDVAKRINFGIFYGAGPTTLAKVAKISRDRAAHYKQAWLDSYSGVRRWIEEVLAILQEEWWLETPFSRRRTFVLAGISPKDESHIQSQAINFPIQSLAADLTKMAMVEVARNLETYHTDAVLIGQVHDSLVIDCPRESLELVRRIVVQTMREPPTSRFGFRFDVPLEVEAKIGSSWYEADVSH